jgi:hypothetical protein
MFEDKYDIWGFIRDYERVRNDIGEAPFDKLSKKKRQQMIELEYLAELLVEIYLSQEDNG